MNRVYKLRTEFFGHNRDVRALTCPSDIQFVSASRDCTARTWHVARDGSEVCENLVLRGHENYVSAVATLKYNSDDLENSIILTGSNDKFIRAYNFISPKPLYKLAGHTDTAVGEDNIFASGSWDKSIKVWKEKTCMATLSGHESAIWSVIFMPSSGMGSSSDYLFIISASADKTIRIWRVGGPVSTSSSYEVTLLDTLTGHTDCVRALTPIDDCRFLSASNDASIRAWHAPTGRCIGEFYGHTNYIYSIATISKSTIFVSSGEDRSIRIWPIPSESEWGEGKQFSCFQTIPMPCQSVWCVVLVPNGDIIAGGSDATIRLFSHEPTRQASEELLKNYELELTKAKIAISDNPSNTSNLDLDNLPGIDALTRPGISEGQVIVINNDNRSVCYQWSSHETRWIEVGDVIGEQNTKLPVYEGKEYDFVLTVDIAEHLPPLKLPYNRSEDPWFVAYNFIQRHDLPTDYLATVANYIIQNAGPQINPPNTNEDLSQSESSGCASKSDKKSDLLMAGLFPSLDFIPLKSISIDSLISKLESFNLDSSKPIASDLLELIKKFDFSYTESQTLNLTTVLLTLLRTWPIEKIFPFLDLLRCLVFWPKCSALIFDASLDHWKFIQSIGLQNCDSNVANCLLVLRLMTNVLASDGSILISNLAESGSSTNVPISISLSVVIGLAAQVCQLVDEDKLKLVTRKQHQLAIGTYFHNLSVLIYASTHDDKLVKMLPQLKFLSGACVRICLNFLSLGLGLGLSGATQLHPDTVYCLFLCMANCLLAKYPNVDTSTDDDNVKTQRIRFLASGASGLMCTERAGQQLSSNGHQQSSDSDLDEIHAWEFARKIISYWLNTPTVAIKVRTTSAQFLSLLE